MKDNQNRTHISTFLKYQDKDLNNLSISAADPMRIRYNEEYHVPKYSVIILQLETIPASWLALSYSTLIKF